MTGIIGLGNMGYAIAQRLLFEGESLTVWNRTPGKEKGLHVSTATSPQEVAGASEVIISVLANDAATQSVYFDHNGLLSGTLEGKVIVEMCTMAPERAKELESAVLAQKGLFLECPVGGTIGPALEGKLLGLAGGSEQAFTKAKPVLEKLTRRLEHFGPAGTGAAMKLAINLPLMVYWTALGEALKIARSHNVDPSIALDVLSDSSGAIGAAKKRVPPIRDMVINGDPGNTNFSLENAIKDLQLMVNETQSGEGTDSIVSAALMRYKKAEKNGFNGFDCSLVAAMGNRQ